MPKVAHEYLGIAVFFLRILHGGCSPEIVDAGNSHSRPKLFLASRLLQDQITAGLFTSFFLCKAILCQGCCSGIFCGFPRCLEQQGRHQRCLPRSRLLQILMDWVNRGTHASVFAAVWLTLEVWWLQSLVQIRRKQPWKESSSERSMKPGTTTRCSSRSLRKWRGTWTESLT